MTARRIRVDANSTRGVCLLDKANKSWHSENVNPGRSSSAGELQRACDRVERSLQELRKAREERDRAIVSALAEDGVRQVDVVRVTGLTREAIRRIARGRGVLG